MTLPIETVRGSPYETGVQHGRLFRHVVHGTPQPGNIEKPVAFAPPFSGFNLPRQLCYEFIWYAAGQRQYLLCGGPPGLRQRARPVRHQSLFGRQQLDQGHINTRAIFRPLSRRAGSLYTATQVMQHVMQIFSQAKMHESEFRILLLSSD